MNKRVYIGTSGYSYEDWIGPFYPSGIKKNQMLAYYARHFNCVEINFTYYADGNGKIFQHMNAQTPNGFKFVVKLNRKFTHDRKYDSGDVKTTLKNVDILRSNDKFSGFLAQFPYSFKKNREHVNYLKNLLEQFKGQPLFLEFRNDSWNDARLLKLIREYQMEYVNVDEPFLSGLMPPQNIVSLNTAYYRFHGRNYENWWTGKNEERYDYLYGRDELEKWLIEISKVLKKGLKAFIFFNNHPQGKAVKNAFQVQDYLNSMEGQ